MIEESADCIIQLCNLRRIGHGCLKLNLLITVERENTHNGFCIDGIVADMKLCLKTELAHDVDELGNISNFGKINGGYVHRSYLT